ncbi:BPL-N domain-containing protein [Actinocatenispora rupis]|uniref:Biotin-protein ligase N-terminal domain-containing protein n=1 Tax=Actinocatenispora rupis TaxID=519421 RepID=A0A8J3J436_9ACTN|nr:BPL-N domain-containing protein [Actinocatenispora rupis]GID13823.1 hypothetical protein Aru02nite_47120 [Actinocatenispora rupis]
MRRRAVVLGAVGAAVAAAGCGPGERHGGLALVYRGPVSLPGCPEAAANLVRRARPDLRVAYCGPGERRPLTAATLASAVLYVQPGGGDLDPAWRETRRYAPALRHWVRTGGRYLGICLGGYLAGADPGFALLPGDSDEYVGSPGATVPDERDTVIAVSWRGHRRHLYFQDGPLFRVTARATVLARYDTGAVAALVAPCGSGRVGVVGPHPEADRTWYADAHLTNPDGVRFDLGTDLVRHTLGS